VPRCPAEYKCAENDSDGAYNNNNNNDYNYYYCMTVMVRSALRARFSLLLCAADAAPATFPALSINPIPLRDAAVFFFGFDFLLPCRDDVLP